MLHQYVHLPSDRDREMKTPTSRILEDNSIPPAVLEISRRLREGEYQVFLVGGAVRDFLLGVREKDWDIATNASPGAIRDLFPHTKSFHLKHGTITLVIKGRHVEVTTFRGPEVRAGSGIEEDLAHRDFTINAMAYDLIRKSIIDPFGGREDIRGKMVRAVLDPMERFQEDPLRMMRAIRFSQELGYSIDTKTLTAITSFSSAISGVAVERIRDELMRLLMVNRPSAGFNLMRKTGLLKVILPELAEGYRKRQSDFHKYTIYRHIMETVDAIEREPVLRLSALFHDIAKPRVREKIKGRWRFFSHAEASAELTRQIMRRLRFSNELTSRVSILVAHHMFDCKKELSDRAIRRFIKRIGAEHVDELMRLRKADDLAHGWGKDYGDRTGDFWKRVHDQMNRAPALSISDLALNGHDVMAIAGLPAGPRVGYILNKLLEDVLENPEHNRRETLIDMLKQTKQR
jgi:tRNA nucleotidyltransferase (CCA-adding enzyme)